MNNRIAKIVTLKLPNYLLFRWPLTPVVPDKQPALQVRWTDDGQILVRVVEHDASVS